MTNAAFTHIKDFVLQRNTYFTTGFANVHQDPYTGRIVSDNNNIELITGINDNLGNYFYIRSEPAINYGYSRNQLSGCKNSQDASYTGTLVAIHKGADPKLLNLNLVNTLLNYSGGEFSARIQPIRSIFFASGIIEKEFSQLDEKDQQFILQRVYTGKLTLVSVEFRITFEIHPTSDPNCIVNPCINC